MKLALLGSFFLVSFILLGGTAPTVQAEGIEVSSQDTQNKFPSGIQFSVALGSTRDITTVRLRSRVMPDGVSVTTRPECTTGTKVTCNALVGSTASSYMVPGAQVVYSWEVQDASGVTLQTPEQSTTYLDSRFTWQSMVDGNLTMYFYSGSEQSNSSVIRTARESIDRFSKLEGTNVTIPVKIWVYNTARDLQPAVASRSRSGPSNTIVTLGEVAASDTALVSRDTDFLNIVRHEITHIVTRSATADHIAEFPIWINEGLSTYAQKDLLPSESQALNLAIKNNRTLPIVSLGASARGSGDQVSLFYSQAGSIVAFMIEKLGEDKFAPFIQAIKNDTLDNALKKTYGLDLAGLENEWRKSVGLAPVDPPSNTTNRTEQAQPTIVPFGAQSGSSSGKTPTTNGNAAANQQAKDGGGSSALPFVIGGIAVVIVLAGLGFAVLKRRAGNTGT